MVIVTDRRALYEYNLMHCSKMLGYTNDMNMWGVA
jgi:hypothetical protein